MDGLDRADVQTARRLHGNQQRLFPIQLTGDNRLLLVAARHGAHRGDRALSAADIKALDQLVCILAHGVKTDEAVVLEVLLAEALEHNVFFQRVAEHKPVLVPVGRDVRHACVRAAADALVRDLLAAERDVAARDAVKPRDALDQLRLPVAVDACDADDLTRAHVKADVFNSRFLMQMGRHRKIAHLEDRRAGVTFVFDDLKLHRSADHHSGQLLLGDVRRVDRADAFSLAQNRHAVRHRHDLVELVRDKQNRLAVGGKALHDLHQLVDLLRGEYRRRLVKDQDLVVAVEHLEDLHALLHADRDVLDLRVEIDMQPVFLGQRSHGAACLFLLQEAELRGLGAENDVVEDGEHVDQLEVLMHHADAERGGVVGVIDLHDLAVFEDLAALGPVQPEQHRHQRGLARAVLAEQGVNLAAPQRQRHIIVGHDAGKHLGDVPHLDDVVTLICILCHNSNRGFCRAKASFTPECENL